MYGSSVAAWILLFLLLAMVIGSLPVIKKVKKCSWIEAAIILLTWLGLIKDEPNQIMCDRSLGMKLLEVATEYTDVPNLSIEKNIISNSYCYQSGLPYIVVRFIPSPKADVELAAYHLKDVFESHVARFYPEHTTENFIEVFTRDRQVYIQIRYAWKHEEEKILAKVDDRSLHYQEKKAIRAHQKPSSQMLNQKLDEVKQRQREEATGEKKTLS